MSIGKSLRFEVFARDGFTCQYCGRRPPEVVLELDHVHPASKGGSDDITNLIASCYDCNRGKRAKVLSQVAPRPDADLAFLKTQQELAEVRRYLAAKKKLDSLHSDVCDSIRTLWKTAIGNTLPTDTVLIPWIKKYGAEEVEASVYIAARKWGYGKYQAPDDYIYRKAVPWTGAILRNRLAKQREEMSA
jgi:hypothetical protein